MGAKDFAAAPRPTVRMAEHPDRFLVARLLRGDEAAFSEFFEANFGALFRFALPRVGGDAHAAEEVVQATLCRAVRKLDTFRGEAALLTWLCTFCRHEISARYEKERRKPPMVDLVDELPEVRAALESLSAARPETALQRGETARLVQLVLDRLPGRYGDALEWKYIDGLSVAEIAARLGVSAKAAESMLTRAREAFRDAFTAAYGAAWAGVEV
jgi:RNA polymerase sigma-70 factor, ECF subfamily